ncbi:hypothetical protein LTR17_006345 [Elasticomyces elasticus]|nr:hypothetical protein LTR17_006345 [Elasticomyces elasticus]
MAYELFVLAIIAILLYMIKRDINQGLTAKLAEPQYLSFDLRAQILANASALWMLTYPKISATNASSSDTGSKKPPRMTIMLARWEGGTRPLYIAEVVAFGSMDKEHTHKMSFLESMHMPSAEEALRNLLDVTAVMVDRKRVQGLGWWPSGLGEYAKGGGQMYEASYGCDRCSEGMVS